MGLGGRQVCGKGLAGEFHRGRGRIVTERDDPDTDGRSQVGKSCASRGRFSCSLRVVLKGSRPLVCVVGARQVSDLGLRRNVFLTSYLTVCEVVPPWQFGRATDVPWYLCFTGSRLDISVLRLATKGPRPPLPLTHGSPYPRKTPLLPKTLIYFHYQRGGVLI